MQDKRRFFSGVTLEQAIARAARHYEVDPKELAYREREKKHGFLNRRKGVVVEVNPSDLLARSTGSGESGGPLEGAAVAEPAAVAGHGVEGSWHEAPRAPEEAAQGEESGVIADELFSEEWWHGEEPVASGGAESGAAAGVTEREESEPEPSRAASRERPGEPGSAPGQPVGPAAEGVAAEAARDGLQRIMRLAGVSLDFELRQASDRLAVELSGNDQGVVLDRGGEVLLAIEHLLPRLIRGISGTGVPCRVDAGGFHSSREASLRELAERRAGEVGRSGRRRTLPPMSPEERRVVHMALAERGDVTTESRGEGFFKRVTISPVGGSGAGR